MRPDPSGQIAGFLASNRQFVIADLWSFRTAYGEVLRYSGYSVPFTVPASFFATQSVNAGSSTPSFFSLGPKFGRSHVSTKIGTAVETMDLKIFAGPSDSVGNMSWQQAFFNDVFDLATVELGRLVCSVSPGQGLTSLVGYVIWFQGLVGDVEFGRTSIDVTVNSTLILMTAQYPRRLWQHTCSHVFGDAMCQFDRQSRAITLQAAAATSGAILVNYDPIPTNLYDDGTIVALSGANTGFKRTISVLNSATVFLTAPFIFTVQSGDYFSLLPGCDHSLSTCQNTFNNLQHYGGAPYIPQAEFSI